MRGDLFFATDEALFRLWRYLHAERNARSALAPDPHEDLLRAVTVELVARGLL